jgi:hypothetical protein
MQTGRGFGWEGLSMDDRIMNESVPLSMNYFKREILKKIKSR